jgi:glycosyltransferase involved in cell wall biosynthesis
MARSAIGQFSHSPMGVAPEESKGAASPAPKGGREQGAGALRIYEYCPSTDGGHPRYVDHFADALSGVGGMMVFWIAGTDLPARFDAPGRTILRVMPTIRPRSQFKTRLHWVADRVRYHLWRELVLLKVACRLPKGSFLHLQEWNWAVGALLNLIVRGCGKRVVITVHNLRPHQFPPWVPRRLVRALERETWRTADGLIVHDQAQEVKLREMLGTRCPPVAVIPHGVWSDHERTDSTAAGKFEHTSDALNADRPLRLLCFGSIRRNKGFETALRTLCRLTRPARLTIAGGVLDAAYAQELREEASRLTSLGFSIEVDLRFIPEEETPSLFRQHDLLLLPYRDFDAQSGVLFDAIAFRTPCVVSTAGALGRTVTGLGIGVIVDSNDPEDWAIAIDRIGPEQLRAFRASLDAAAEEVSWEKAARVSLALFEQLRA